MPFPTLAFNEGIIIGTIDILQTFAKQLGFNKEMFCDKMIIMRDDLFTMRNMT